MNEYYDEDTGKNINSLCTPHISNVLFVVVYLGISLFPISGTETTITLFLKLLFHENTQSYRTDVLRRAWMHLFGAYGVSVNLYDINTGFFSEQSSVM